MKEIEEAFEAAFRSSFKVIPQDFDMWFARWPNGQYQGEYRLGSVRESWRFFQAGAAWAKDKE